MNKKDKTTIRGIVAFLTFAFLTFAFSKMLYDYTSVLETAVFGPIDELKVLCFIFMAVTILFGVLLMSLAVLSGIGFIYFTCRLFCVFFSIESKIFNTVETKTKNDKNRKRYSSKYTNGYIEFN